LEDDALVARQEYSTPLARAEHSADLAEELQETLITQPTEYWVSRLDAAGVPGGPVLSYGEALQQEQVKARDMVVDIEHPKVWRMSALGPTPKISQTPQTVRRPAPMLGEHTREVFSEFGLSRDDVEKLESDGAITQHFFLTLGSGLARLASGPAAICPRRPVCERIAQLCASPMDPRLHRADLDTEHLGDLLVAE